MVAASRSRALTAGLAALTLSFAACGDDAAPTVAGDAPADAGGTIELRLEDTDAVFIEGFELGLRFTDANGDVLKALLWSDFVNDLGGTTIDAFYESVLEQPVPAGTTTVEADFRMSIGGPIEPPDLEGEFPCSLDVDVPAGATIAVEVAFSAEPGCITQVS